MKKTVIDRWLRQAFALVYKSKCQYCGQRHDDLEVDHIIPIAKGGADDISNMTLACASCNQRKRDLLIDDMFLAIAHARAASNVGAIESKVRSLKQDAVRRTKLVGRQKGSVNSVAYFGRPIRYLITRPRKLRLSFYWAPSAALIARGFSIVRLSNNPTQAAAQAERLNASLDRWYVAQESNDVEKTQLNTLNETTRISNNII